MWLIVSLVVTLSLSGSSAVCPCEHEQLCQPVQQEHEFEVSIFAPLLAIKCFTTAPNAYSWVFITYVYM